MRGTPVPITCSIRFVISSLRRSAALYWRCAERYDRASCALTVTSMSSTPGCRVFSALVVAGRPVDLRLLAAGDALQEQGGLIAHDLRVILGVAVKGDLVQAPFPGRRDRARDIGGV